MYNNFMKKQLKENKIRYIMGCIIIWNIIMFAFIRWYNSTSSENCCNPNSCNNCNSMTIQGSLKQGCDE